MTVTSLVEELDNFLTMKGSTSSVEYLKGPLPIQISSTFSKAPFSFAFPLSGLIEELDNPVMMEGTSSSQRNLLFP